MKRGSCCGPLVLLAMTGAVALVAWPALRTVIGGASRRDPAEMQAGLSPEARGVFDRALAGIEPARLFDHHVHVAGVGVDGSGCSVHPSMRSFLHPWRRLQLSVYMSAAGVDDIDRADPQFVERLVGVARAFPAGARFGVLALDARWREDGTRDDDGTPVHVPNDYVARICERHPDLFVPIASIHPYRPDALEELDRCGARGVRFVKWLPNSMGIDPADARCVAFYERMKLRGMALISHAGDEHALAAAAGQQLGNPLRLRAALDRGVKVVVAHCGTLGKGEDLDDARRRPPRNTVANFDLFMRLMDEPRYAGLVFGELSATCQVNRDERVLRTLLERQDLHPRLVNGSDWPLPAINSLVSTRRLEHQGFLTRDERKALNEIYDFDPLLFDLVLKRTIRGRNGERFPASVFEVNPALGP